MSHDLPAFDVNAVDLGPGRMLLEASAGTGKTWSLTTLAARALLEGRIDDIDQLLMVTFTKAATDDLRTRLRARLQETLEVAIGARDPSGDPFLDVVPGRCTDAGQRRLVRALRDFDRARIHTIHSYCARLLQETAFEAGLDLELGEPSDAAPMRRAALEDAWRELVVEGPPWLVALAALEGWSPGEHAGLVDEVARHRRLDVRPHGAPLDEVGGRVAAALAKLERDVDRVAVLAVLEPCLDPAAGLLKKSPPKSRLAAERAIRALAIGHADAASRSIAWIGLAHHLAQVASKNWRAKALDAAPWFAVLGELGAALEPVLAALRSALLERTQVRLQRNKVREETLDFDDLIARVRASLDDPRRRPTLVRLAQASTRMACIDEFQDTDVDQWEIFRTLFGEACTLVLVGDPKQAIYGFRGADVFAYLDARAVVRTGGGQEFGLARNFRSHPELVRGVNLLFGHGFAAFAAEGIDHADVQPHRSAPDRALLGDEGPALRIEPVLLGKATKAAFERAVIVRMVEEIQRLLASPIELAEGPERRPLGPGDITVLTRKHRQSAKVHRALREAGIASVLGRSGDVHESEAMEELGLLLDAIVDARDLRAVRRAVATRLWGGTVATLHELDASDTHMAEVLTILDDLRRTWLRFGVLVAVDRFVQRQGVVERLLGEPEGDRLLTDLRHALELVHRAALEGDLSPLGTVAWLWRERTRSHQQDDQRQLRLDRDDDAVRILTAHGSKGLEYEVVFVPFAWEGKAAESPFRWHEEIDGERSMVLDHRDAATVGAGRARAERELLAEDLRLLYVALTRAKRRGVVFTTDYHSSRSNTAGRSALHYVLHRPAAHEGEAHAAYVSRCIAELAEGSESWTPAVPTRIARDPNFGRLPSGTTVLPRRAGARPEPTFVARSLPSDLGRRLIPWSMVSFTSLVRFAGHERGFGGARALETVEPETDEIAVAERADPPARTALLRTDAPAGIFAFARGARAGVCLHEILERSDFEVPIDASRDTPARQRIARILARHGLDGTRAHAGGIDPQAVAEELVRTASREPFPFGGFPLSSVPRAHRLDEWEFRAALGRVRVRDLARVFAEHAGAPWDRWLPPRLQRVSDQVVEGLLGGFVDLVFEHEGRWFVVDWKSNHLGDHVDDYGPDAIDSAMLEHDYVLQLSLYSVAVHRFLRVRLRGYRYEEHFGGAAYAFVRGWCGRSDRGWFAWKPPIALIDALDRTLALGGDR